MDHNHKQACSCEKNRGQEPSDASKKPHNQTKEKTGGSENTDKRDRGLSTLLSGVSSFAGSLFGGKERTGWATSQITTRV